MTGILGGKFDFYQDGEMSLMKTAMACLVAKRIHRV